MSQSKIPSVQESRIFKSNTDDVLKAKDSEFVKSVGPPGHNPHIKIGYSSRIDKLKYNQLSDDVRYDKKAKESIKSERAKVVLADKIAVTNIFRAAAQEIAFNAVQAKYEEARQQHKSGSVPTALSEYRENIRHAKMSTQIGADVEVLVRSKFPDATQLAGLKRVTVGDVRSIIPDVDALVAGAVKQFTERLDAKLALGPEAKRPQEVIEKLVVKSEKPPRSKARKLRKVGEKSAGQPASQTRITVSKSRTAIRRAPAPPAASPVAPPAVPSAGSTAAPLSASINEHTPIWAGEGRELYFTSEFKQALAKEASPEGRAKLALERRVKMEQALSLGAGAGVEPLVALRLADAHFDQNQLSERIAIVKSVLNDIDRLAAVVQSNADDDHDASALANEISKFKADVILSDDVARHYLRALLNIATSIQFIAEQYPNIERAMSASRPA